MSRKPIIITADLHLHEHPAYAVDRDGMNSRLLDGRDTFLEIAEYAHEHKITDILFAGDWFHSRRKISVATLDVSEETIDRARALDVHITAIPGNHDESLDGRACSITGQPFKRVVIKPGTVNVSGWKVGCIPWTDDPKHVRETIKSLTQWGEDADVLIGHFGVEGTRVGPADFEMPGHIGVDVFKGVKCPVFLGHYHTQQEIPGTTAFYVGSPMQLSWGEAKDTKQFAVLHPNGKIKWVPLERAPRFKRLTIDKLSEARAQDFVEVVIPDKDQLRRAQNAVSAVRKSNPTTIVVSKAETADAPDLQLAGLKVREQLSRYIDHVGAPKGVDRKELLKIGLTLLGGSDV